MLRAPGEFNEMVVSQCGFAQLKSAGSHFFFIGECELALLIFECIVLKY